MVDHIEARARKIVSDRAEGQSALAEEYSHRIEKTKANTKWDQAYKDDLIRQYTEAAAVAKRVAEIIRKGLE